MTSASAQPFTIPGNATGVLVSHGFTSTPQSVRAWAEHLGGAGFSVSAPRLAGHGSTWQDLNATRWPDWFASVTRALHELRESCDTVVVAGQSLGGALALRLAQEYSDLVDGIILVNPAVRLDDPRLRALPLLKRLIPALPGVGGDIKKPGAQELAYTKTPLKALHSMLDCFTEVRRDLPSVKQPLLLFRSATDHVVPATSSAEILSRVGSGSVTEHVLTNSYHVATLDNDAEAMFEMSTEFIHQLSTANHSS